MSYKIVLASASPRRKMLLEQIGIEFDIWPSNKEENTAKSIPSEICVELSRIKALDTAAGIKAYNDTHPDIVSPQDILVVGADTIVAYENEVLGKPHDENDAKRMLTLLSGKEHHVYTGVTFVFISSDGRVGEYSFYEKTGVTFYELSEDEIDKYIRTKDALDKAGSYGIQGAFAQYIKEIHGDYYNVVGLPIGRLVHELKILGVNYEQ